jgi:LytS/YehU family sensor histidine kinase
MEFNEMYMAMQDRRFGGRIHQEICVQPELHDALVPAMILQPILENAYRHGLSHVSETGLLKIEARRENARLRVDVLNSGIGLNPERSEDPDNHNLGLVNVRDRLQLHYGENHSFSISEVDPAKVLVSITLPLQLCEDPPHVLAEYGA